jgi:hypothetical protein
VHSSFDIRLVVPINAVAANGGPISSAGTWQISDFSSGTTSSPVNIRGTVVAEPPSFGLAGIALVSVAFMSRVRRKLSARA